MPLRARRRWWWEAKTLAIEQSRQTRFSEGDPGVGDLVGGEPVAEGGVVLVNLQQGVAGVGVVVVTLEARVLEPRVVALGRKREHPARHRR